MLDLLIVVYIQCMLLELQNYRKW